MLASLKVKCSKRAPKAWLCALRGYNVLRRWEAALRYHNPSRRIKLVGVTGTNGKTTTATLLWQLFESMGCKCGLISTAVYRIHDKEYAAGNTTPSLLSINKLLSQMVKAGCQYCFMEVSSHAVVQRRIAGLRFAGGIFSNLTHDHLDYHRTFAEYLAAKKLFFDELPSEAFALTNVDDRSGSVMVEDTRARAVTYALNSMADFCCTIKEQRLDSTLLCINDAEFVSPLIGSFNAYNVCAAYAAACLLLEDAPIGLHSERPADYMHGLTGARGRFERIAAADGRVGVIDYAHTPDALSNVIAACKGLLVNTGGRLAVVVGCGGDRDRSKRPVMAQIAARNAWRAILTSDNPRTEDPSAILQDMQAGLSDGDRKYVEVIADRREAIRRAAALAGKGDIILVAGKGHEDYQIVGTAKHHFDDKEELEKAFLS